MTFAEATEKYNSLLNELRELAKSTDFEAAHARADEILLEFAPTSDIREAYEVIVRWRA